MPVKAKSPTWGDVKKVLSQKEHGELLKLVGDLYSLNKTNKTFVQTRYQVGTATFEPYKKIISDALYPDIVSNKPVRLSVGRKAISDYKKATKDTIGTIDLMITYVEWGTKFTVDYGDIDEQFYRSLELMMENTLAALVKEGTKIQDKFYPRLASVVDSASGIGWGYSDYIADLLYQYFPEY
jgi:hypothetical protein